MLTVFPAALSVATLIAAAEPQAAAHGASCAGESRPAHIVQSIQPEYPEIAQFYGLSGRTIVRVSIGDDGRLTSTAVNSSSGSAILDAAAVRAAKAMTYAPAIQACKAVAGSYALEVNFPE